MMSNTIHPHRMEYASLTCGRIFYAIYHYVPFTDLCAEGGKNVGAFGYHGYHLPRPAGLSGTGCAWCVKVAEQRFQQALGVLRRGGASFGKLFREDEDGYTEVAG